MRLSRLDWLLLLTLSVLTFEKIRWETPIVTLTWTNLLATAFVVAFIVDRVRSARDRLAGDVEDAVDVEQNVRHGA